MNAFKVGVILDLNFNPPSFPMHLIQFLCSIIYMVMPIYISEISPKDSTGMLTSLIGHGYALGILAALCTNIGFSKFHIGWRVAMIIQALSGLLFAVGAKWIPRTPR